MPMEEAFIKLFRNTNSEDFNTFAKDEKEKFLFSNKFVE